MYDPNDVLLPYQKRWIDDKSIVKIAEKSRRTGLTWAEAADAVLTAASARSAGGRNHFYVGSTKEMAREFIDAAAMWANIFNEAAGEIREEIFNDEDKDILTFVIYFASGFKVQALSSNPRNLRGLQGNVTVDEAAFHERLDEVLKAALALTMWGAKIRLISTHNGVESLFNQLIEETRKGQRKGWQIHRITLDDACREGLYKRICQTTGQEWSIQKEVEWKENLRNSTATKEDALEEYDCVPKHSSGAYIPYHLLTRAAREAHKVIRFTAPEEFMSLSIEEQEREAEAWIQETLTPFLSVLNEDDRHSIGEDFARSGDLTVIAICAIKSDTTRMIRRMIELKNMPYKQQEQIFKAVVAMTPRVVGMALDSTGNGGYLGEQATLNYGASMVDAVMLSNKYYQEWMPPFKSLFESGYIEIPKDEEIIQDHRKIQNIGGIPKIDKGTTKSARGGNRHGDSAVAAFLAVRASYMEGGIIEFTALTDSFDDDGIHDIKDRGCW